MKNITNVIVSALIALVVTIGVIFGFMPKAEPQVDQSKNVGGLSELLTKTAKLIVGERGTGLTKLIGTTCDLIGTNASQTASTTVAYDCSVPGLESTDLIMASLASTTVARAGNVGWTIVAAKASSTANYATILLANLTGTNATPSVTSVGSSTILWLFRNR